MEIFFDAELEIRAKGDGRSLRGAFPYNKTATIRDRGRVRKERFKSGAFGWQIEEFAKLQTELAKVMKDAHAEAVSILKEKIERRNVNLLSGHDFNRPLGSMKAGTLKLVDSDDALRFEADLPAENRQPSWMRDAILSVENGLAGGVSPGFRIPPAGTVANAEEIIPEPGNPGVSIRQINQAVLYELSIVSRPAYAETAVEARDEGPIVKPQRRRRIWL